MDNARRAGICYKKIVICYLTNLTKGGIMNEEQDQRGYSR